MDPQCVLIDGYNVIRNTPSLTAAERHGLSAGREALLAQVIAHFRHMPHRVVVVFDGDQASETVHPLRCGSRSQVIYARRGETADMVIVRLAAEERAYGVSVVVASDDLEVRLGGASYGAAEARAADVAHALNAAPRDVARRARHRQAVRESWRRDVDDADDGAARGHPRRGNPRRAPKRRCGERKGPAL